MSVRIALAALALVTAAPAAAMAQEDRGDLVQASADDSQAQIILRERREAASDEIRALVFSPEFIMANGRAITLTDRQRDQMTADLQGLQRQLVAQQDQMHDARAALVQALRAEPANQERVLSALDGVLAIERQVKRLQLPALVRLREALTPSQRARLEQLRDSR
jgi:Spy/CpxP family protein refolding chaperone